MEKKKITHCCKMTTYILCRYVVVVVLLQLCSYPSSVCMLLSDFPLFWSCFKKHTRGSIRQNEFTVKIGSRPLMGKVPISNPKNRSISKRGNDVST